MNGAAQASSSSSSSLVVGAASKATRPMNHMGTNDASNASPAADGREGAGVRPSWLSESPYAYPPGFVPPPYIDIACVCRIRM
jgi:hypothetical protein